jgi:hypothetical protein
VVFRPLNWRGVLRNKDARTCLNRRISSVTSSGEPAFQKVNLLFLANIMIHDPSGTDHSVQARMIPPMSKNLRPVLPETLKVVDH